MDIVDPRPSANLSFQIPGLALSWKYPKLLITSVSCKVL